MEMEICQLRRLIWPACRPGRSLYCTIVRLTT